MKKKKYIYIYKSNPLPPFFVVCSAGSFSTKGVGGPAMLGSMKQAQSAHRMVKGYVILLGMDYVNNSLLIYLFIYICSKRARGSNLKTFEQQYIHTYIYIYIFKLSNIEHRMVNGYVHFLFSLKLKS